MRKEIFTSKKLKWLLTISTVVDVKDAGVSTLFTVVRNNGSVEEYVVNSLGLSLLVASAL